MKTDLFAKIIKPFKKKQDPGFLKNEKITATNSEQKEIENSFKKYYFQYRTEEENSKSMAELKHAVADFISRLKTSRMTYVPWLKENMSLNGCKVLEVGCGTGSSLIALAEQGAEVTGIDMDENAIGIARDLCVVFNVSARLLTGNAENVMSELNNQQFDLVLFIATLEHMLYCERINCIREYFNHLTDNGYIGIFETPNRLWYFDAHTGMLPFFHWLQDDIALDYIKTKQVHDTQYCRTDHPDMSYLHLARRGRGFSFHELEIALNTPAEKIIVTGYMAPSLVTSLDQSFHEIIASLNPNINRGFFYPFIDVLIKKAGKQPSSEISES
jgi:2-polyprenyl-3-methyl-5-hydroxy-6-metoxy-1,4-benzoquinol methylase